MSLPMLASRTEGWERKHPEVLYQSIGENTVVDTGTSERRVPPRLAAELLFSKRDMSRDAPRRRCQSAYWA